MRRENMAFKRLVIRLLSVVDRVLQLLIPVDKARLSYGSYPEYSDNSYYLYRHAVENRDGLLHVWLLRHDFSLESKIRDDFEAWCAESGNTNNRLIVLKRRSVLGYWHFLRSYAVFHTHGVFPFSRCSIGRHNVALWHGMPIKAVGELHKVNPNPFPPFGSKYIATSPFFQYIMGACFAVPVEQVLVCRMPRCDVLVGNAGESGANIKAILGVEESKKLVLWMPTYRVETFRSVAGQATQTFIDDLPDWGLSAINAAAEANNCEVIVKLHGYDSLNTLDFEFSQSNLTLLRADEWLSHGVQLYDLLRAADGLISDVSSVLIDYLVTEKPLGVIGFDLATYTREITFPVEWVMNSQAVHCLDSADAVAQLFGEVAAGKKASVAEGDIATIFNESSQESGSSVILRNIGV